MVVDTLGRLLPHLPPAVEQGQMLAYLYGMTQSALVPHRHVAVELLARIWTEPWLWDLADTSSSSSNNDNDNNNTREESSSWTPIRPTTTTTVPPRSCLKSTRPPDDHKDKTPRRVAFDPEPCPTVVLPSNSNNHTYTNNNPKASPASLLQALLGRLEDVNVSTRQAAFVAVAQLTDQVQDMLHELNQLQISMKERQGQEGDSDLDQEAYRTNNQAKQMALWRMIKTFNLHVPWLIQTARRLVDDETMGARVRKEAVHTLGHVLVWHVSSPAPTADLHPQEIPTSLVTPADVHRLAQGCQEEAVAPRKASAVALTRLFQAVCCQKRHCVCPIWCGRFVSEWTSSVLPLTLSPDNSVATKAVELVQELALTPLLLHQTATDGSRTNTTTMDGAVLVAWKIWANLAGGPLRTQTSPVESQAMQTVLASVLAVPDQSLLPLQQLLLLLVHQVSTDPTDGETSNETDSIRMAGAWSLWNALVSTPQTVKLIPGIVQRNKMDLNFLCTAWKSILDKSMEHAQTASTTVAQEKMLLEYRRKSMKHSMWTLAQLASCIDPEKCQSTKSRILEMLQSFYFPAMAINPAVSMLIALTLSEPPNDTSLSSSSLSSLAHKRHCQRWMKQLYHVSEQALAHVLTQEGSTVVRWTPKLLCALFTAGEVAMIGCNPSEADESEPPLQDAEVPEEPEEQSPRPILEDDAPRSTVVGEQVLRGLRLAPSPKLVELVQLYMGSQLPVVSSLESSNSNTNGDEANLPSNNNRARPIPNNIRTMAFLTFGRFCVRGEELARTRGIILLARALHENMEDGCEAIQRNALATMRDLCKRYTNLADRYLPLMAACLQAGLSSSSNTAAQEYAQVRKTALMLLSGLLVEDTIKWRGLFFHRFLVATTDENSQVACLARAIVGGPFQQKFPELFRENLIGSFFVLNGCSGHAIYQAAASLRDAGSGSAVSGQGLARTGPLGEKSRFYMYHVLLSHMTDEDKLIVRGRLAKEILGSALVPGSDLYKACTQYHKAPDRRRSSISKSTGKNKNPTYESEFWVLSDALGILTSPRLRVAAPRDLNRVQEEEEVEDEVAAADGTSRPPSSTTLRNTTKSKHAAAMSNLLSKVGRTHMLESILPILCNLKTLLQRHGSPLSKQLMWVLCDLYRLYTAQVKVCLANDSSLLGEIEHDVRRQNQLAKQSMTTTTASSGDR